MGRRSNHALLYLGAHLGSAKTELAVDGMRFVGDETDDHTFHVPTDDAADAYITMQAFDVDVYGHEIRINGEPLSGFDLPPSSGWQHWMDRVSGTELVAGENTLKIARDPDSRDSFAVGTVVVHWTEPAE